MRRARPVLQMEAAECGAACLAMVLDAHGRVVTIEEARAACGTSRDGVDIRALLAAAQTFGLESQPVAREPETLADLPLPAILHWGFDHFVVLESVRGGRFTLLDPRVGRRVLDRTEMGKSFTGVALAFTPGEGFTTGGTRPSVLATLVQHARGSRDGLAIVFLCGVLGLVPAIAFAGAVQVFVDHVIGQARTSWIVFVLVALLAGAATQSALGALQAWTVANLKAKIGVVVATQGFRHALFLPLAFFAQRDAGELVSRLRVGAEIGGTVAGPLARIPPNAVTLAGLIALVALHDVLVGLTLAIVAALVLFVLHALARRMAEANRSQHVLDARAGGIATSGFAAFDAFRLLGREDMFARRWMGAEAQALDAEQRLGKVRALATLGPVATPLLLVIVVLVVGSGRVMAGDATLGSLIALQVLAGLSAAPLGALARDLCDLQESAGALARLDDLANHPRDPLLTGAAVAAPHLRRDAPVLSLEGVSFAFGPGKPLFNDVSLSLAPGELVALTGASGAGKSTLARIAAGLVSPDTGDVRVSGVAIAEWPRTLLRERLAYVPQESAVFAGTLAENVSLHDARIEAGAIARALEIAGVGHLLSRGGGLAAPLTSETPALSGGEVQRLALARALVRQPQVIVLDETTSALDLLREAEVLDNLRDTGASILCVTHRAGTQRRCDRALTLDGSGRLVAVTPQAQPSSIPIEAGMRLQA
ncbi:MAG: ATP-binding cassette domain-containing protein [Salinarimonas sp.]|nr:ATP-binding cassette domain-containing protein [Salinarimonas sp.]